MTRGIGSAGVVPGEGNGGIGIGGGGVAGGWLGSKFVTGPLNAISPLAADRLNPFACGRAAAAIVPGRVTAGCT
jgi:hypothetical protein